MKRLWIFGGHEGYSIDYRGRAFMFLNDVVLVDKSGKDLVDATARQMAKMVTGDIYGAKSYEKSKKVRSLISPACARRHPWHPLPPDQSAHPRRSTRFEVYGI